MLIYLQTVEFPVDLPYVKIVGEKVAIIDLMNLAHDFGAIVAQVFYVDRRFLSGLRSVLLHLLQNQHVAIKSTLDPFLESCWVY